MNSLANIIGIVLMTIGSLTAVATIFYLRRKSYLNKKASQSVVTSLIFEKKLTERYESVYHGGTVYKLNRLHKPHTVHVKKDNLAYAYEDDYPEVLNGCLNE